MQAGRACPDRRGGTPAGPSARARAAALAAALLLGTALPAVAESGITSPGAGEVVVRADAVVPLRATVDAPASEPSELSLLAPGAQAAEVVATSAEGGELAHDLDTSCATPGCTGRSPAPNGTWTLRLSGAASDERTFVLRIPPAAPQGVEAVPSEAGVLVRWAQGDEPDLRAYRIEDGRGRLVRDRIPLGTACDPERTCSVEVPEDAGAWTVRAYRATCPDCREVLLSPASAAVRAQGAGAPAAPPAAEPATAAPTATAAAPAVPVRRPDQRSAFLESFGAGRPVAPAPAPEVRRVLPALPQADGSFEQELGYEERELVVAEPRRPPLSRATDAVGTTLGGGNRLPLLVLSGLLVGGALWLRRWARRAIAD